MEDSINLLHLEDDPADAELVQATLAGAGLDLRTHCVETREAYEAALDNGMEIILADYQLPTYDGLSALRLARERCPEIPYIFVSGTMGEDAAIAALTQGATDYVLKKDLARLPSAVQRALKEASALRERRRTQEALRRTHRINAARLRLMQFAVTHSLDELLEEVGNEAERLTDSLVGFYHLVDDAQQTLTRQNWSTHTKAQFCATRGQAQHAPFADAGVWVDCVRQREPVIHNDYKALTRRKGLPQGHPDLVRELVVPVMRGEAVKAIMGVGNKRVDYGEADVEAMTLLADLAWEITERKQAEQQVSLLSFAINGIQEAVFMIDADARFQYVNDAACRLLGRSREELLTMGPVDVNAALSKEAYRDHWRHLKKSGTLTFEGEMKTKEGRLIPVEINANFFEYGGHSFDLGLVRDITERKRAERERQANLWFFENMDKINRAIQRAESLEAMTQAVLDTVLSIFDADRAYLMHPCDPESPTWKVTVARHKPEYPMVVAPGREMAMEPHVAETLRLLLATDGPVCFGQGTINDLPAGINHQLGMESMLAMAIYPRAGSPWQLGLHQCAAPRIWSAEEMLLFEATGRRLADGLSSLIAQRDLRQNEAFLDKVVEHIPNMLFVKDARDLRFVRFNKAGEQLIGYSREALLGKNDYDFFPREEADFFTAKDRLVLDQKAPLDIPEEVIHTRDDQELILHTKKIPILDEGGAPLYLLGISEDISERKRAEAAIRKLSQAVEQSPVSIVITDVNGSIEFVNAKFTQITGYTADEALGQNPRILKSGQTSAAEYRRLWKTISQGGTWSGAFQNRKKSGELFWEQATIAPIRDATDAITHYVAVKEDITERKQLEAQFRQVQKMEAIGQLAGGIAHDFNNILSAIIGFTEISITSVDPQSETNEYLGHVLEASGRAKELIHQILMFSRETEQELMPIRVSLPVKEAIKLIRASLPASIEVRSKILSKASALSDPTQIHQIVMNLCTNAAHAMQAKGGRLDISLLDISIDDGENRRHYTDAKPGDYIRLSVSDEGHGIDAQLLHRIFDPFFTTKEKGEGTGLGLSVVHGIVKSYGGFIYAHSELGQGTTFEILFPAQERASRPHAVLDKPIPRGDETILFVDDETMIVDIAKRLLESLGYQVVTKISAIEALEAFKTDPKGFDLVLTDMAMPKMSGLELAEAIHQIRSEIPIVLCTGFDMNMDEQTIAGHGLTALLHKPILRRDMATVVRKALDQG